MRLIAIAARRVASPCLRRWESTAAASGTGEYRFGITAEQAGAQNELVRRVLSLENAAQAEQNAARVTRAVEVFQREAGDTGSPEVQGECGERCCLGRRSFVFVSLRPRVGGWLTWCVSLSFPSPSPLHARSFFSPILPPRSLAVAVLTKRIAYMTAHLKTHKKDRHSRRGMMAMINKRRKMLTYLRRKDFERYKWVIGELELKDVVRHKAIHKSAGGL